MKAPSSLSADGRKLWQDAFRTLEAQGTWKDTDGPLLERYVVNVLLARASHAAADAEPYVSGSTGQLVSHPARAIARQAEEAAHKAAAELLLTPRSRARAKLADEVETNDEFADLLD